MISRLIAYASSVWRKKNPTEGNAIKTSQTSKTIKKEAGRQLIHIPYKRYQGKSSCKL